MRETAEGYTVVFRSPVMRSIALVVFCGVCFGVVPEGLAAAWSADLAGGPNAVYLGTIMVAAAVGFVAGSIVMTWLVKPQRRNASSARSRSSRPWRWCPPCSTSTSTASWR